MISKRSFIMKKYRACSCLFIFVIFILVFSVRHGSAAEKLSVYVVNYPLKYFAERIGGDHVKVEFPVPAGIDPAYWNPDVEHISAYQKADFIIINGAGYAKWVNKVSLPESKMVNTSRAFKDQYITSKEVMTHSHGAEGKHAHESLSFTTWLDLSLAARQAEAIADAMARKRPALKKTFQTNYASLKKELEALDQDIQTIVSQDRSKPLMVSHPVYDYFARRYGLNIVSVHWEPGEVPSGEQWLELKKILKDHPAKWMIWEGDPLKATIEKLKGLQIESVVFDPCGNVPD
ncbi:MAG: metal ABC transporter substrate-binding protein, partial [Desulfobacterales bacterium]